MCAILGLSGRGLIIFDAEIATELQLVTNFVEEVGSKGFFFAGCQNTAMGSLQFLASVVLRGGLDHTEISWKEDWIDIIQVLSRAAIADSVYSSQAILYEDNEVPRPIDRIAKQFIGTMLGHKYEDKNSLNLMSRQLNTSIEYVWNAPGHMFSSSEVALWTRHPGVVHKAAIERAVEILQRADSLWLMIDFGENQIGVEYHKDWSSRGDVRIVNVLCNAAGWTGNVTRTFITCLKGRRDVNFVYTCTTSLDTIANSINILKVIRELARIGAVHESSRMKKFWLVRGRDLQWTVGPRLR